jgi:hypothetical protein
MANVNAISNFPPEGGGGSLPAQAAHTVLSNNTAGSAVPSANTALVLGAGTTGAVSYGVGAVDTGMMSAAGRVSFAVGGTRLVDIAAGSIMYLIDAASVIDIGSGTCQIKGNTLSLILTSVRQVAVGTAALTTNATAGFFCLPTCPGTPTGTPANIPTGQAPMVVDSTNNKLYAYYGAAWHDMTGT